MKRYRTGIFLLVIYIIVMGVGLSQGHITPPAVADPGELIGTAGGLLNVFYGVVLFVVIPLSLLRTFIRSAVTGDSRQVTIKRTRRE